VGACVCVCVPCTDFVQIV